MRRDKSKSRHSREYGQSWSIATALLDGPLTREGIREYYRAMARRVGIFSDMFSLQNKTGHGLEQHLNDFLEEPKKKGWIEVDAELFRLTDTGREQSQIMLDDLEKSRKILDAATDPKRVSVATLVVHFILAAVKLPAGLLSGSVGLLNDALDTLMDGISSVMVYLGFRFNKERIASFLLVLFMLGTGGYTLYQSVTRIVNPMETFSDVFAFAAALVSGFFCALLWLYQKFSGLRHGSMALIAQSVDSRNHVLVAVSVTIALVSNLLNFSLLDRIVGLIIAVLILKSAAELLRELIVTGGDAEESLSRFGFPGFQRFRKRQFQRWLLYLISGGKAANRRELVAKAKESLDFERIHSFKKLGMHEPRWVGTLVQEGTEELFRRGFAKEKPLAVTKRGEKLLGSVSFFEAMVMEGRRNVIVAAALSLWRAVWRTAVFAAVYIGLRRVLRCLPDFDVWIGGRILLDVSGFHLSVQQLPLIAVGWLFYVAGGLVMRHVSYRLRHIRADQSHRSGRLLTDGIYAFSRHPMYSCFILTQMGIGVALHSLWGLIAGVFFSGISVLNTFYEERKLVAQFGDAYRLYREEVHTRLLPWYGWILLLLPAAGIVAGFVLRT